ncbi:hypothetical protein H2509_06605 [Stappia sp. F7233]|uniref:Uncharacterized protein n=1 Tax=Stappia albiluteola TaxID=2758565 RepID=A0A839AD77_9HYPH|nr:hypothetical protein [Stappia albiluteola]MBA5776797.1 hypothetical protein [Stappia albiluteola]
MDTAEFSLAVICLDHRALHDLYQAFPASCWPAFVDDPADIAFLFNSERFPRAILAIMSGVAGEAEMIRELSRQIRAAPVEVPVMIMDFGGITAAELDCLSFRPAAIVGPGVPLAQVATRMGDASRLTVRMEEARLRRRVFGPANLPVPQGIDAGLLIIGLGGRFSAIERANKDRTRIIGAFTPDMADQYLSEAPFRAVMIDCPPDVAETQIRRLRSDARTFTLPVVAAVDTPEEAAPLYEVGATTVLVGRLENERLARYLSCAIRTGIRRGLANRALSAFRDRFVNDSNRLRLDGAAFQTYLLKATEVSRLRGEELICLKLDDLARDGLQEMPGDADALSIDLASKVALSSAALAREEDLVAEVEGLGGVAVLRGRDAARRLGERVKSILKSSRFA